jgi:protein disulfide-isomerase
MKLKLIFILTAGLLFGTFQSFAGGDGWMTNYDNALNKAQKEGKLVLVQFHGSDWCPPCIQLENEVLSTREFKTIADAALVLVDADFPRNKEQSDAQKKHNQELAKKFGIEGFPTVVLLDRNGKVLDKMVGYPRGGKDGFLKFITDQTSAGS